MVRISITNKLYNTNIYVEDSLDIINEKLEDGCEFIMVTKRRNIGSSTKRSVRQLIRKTDIMETIEDI